MTKRKKYDVNAPEAQELRNKIIHGAFVTEGTMVAFPACFPGVTIPVPADESRITALDITDDGIVYAGTSGYAAHLLVGMFHGVTGMVFDMGNVEGADATAAICCGKKKIFAAVNGPQGGRVVLRDLELLPFDLIQEWDISRSPFEYKNIPVKGERIIHAVSAPDRRTVVGVTETAVFTMDFETASIEAAGEVRGRGRLALGSQGNVFGPNQNGTLWRFDPHTRELTRNAVAMPKGAWDIDTLIWGRDRISGRLFTADAEGRLFSFTEEDGFSDELARIPYAPVGSMAVTLDGRVYGSAGEGMSRIFCFDPENGELTDIGVAVSTLERRRYGYSFADAATGRDGEIIFAEDDDLGHLWIYFPKIKTLRK